MASITEVGVIVTLMVVKEDGVVKVLAQAYSVDSSGSVVRRIQRDVTNDISAARLNGATDLLNDIEQRVKALWNIS